MRWTLSSLVSNMAGRLWVGTFFVNILGCIILFSLVKLVQVETKTLQLFWKIGFLGSLTTFSTFSLEMVLLIKNGRPMEACLVGFLNIFFGVVIGVLVLR